jgi:hypothetical protein
MSSERSVLGVHQGDKVPKGTAHRTLFSLGTAVLMVERVGIVPPET